MDRMDRVLSLGQVKEKHMLLVPARFLLFFSERRFCV